MAASLGAIGAGFFWFAMPGVRFGEAGNAIASGAVLALRASGMFQIAGWASLASGLALAALSWSRSQSRKALLERQQSLADLRAMSWREFEQLVGEYYRRIGYRVSETGQGGADGGIDLLLRRDGETILVQCKQWRTFKVGVAVVREMFGLMVHHHADRVKVVTCGDFTQEAADFARGKPIELIGGGELLELVRCVQTGAGR